MLFRDVAQSEEGRAGFGTSQQGAHDSHSGDDGEDDSHGGGDTGDMVIRIKKKKKSTVSMH